MAMEELGSTTPQTFSPNSFFTPLLISIMGISATALAILMYHLLVVRYCIRRRQQQQLTRMLSFQSYPSAAAPPIPTGVDQKTLLTIPIITYNHNHNDSPLIECTVCLGDVEDGDMVRLLPNCKHLFHVKCIDEWFVGHTSCPVCRVPVVAPTDEEVLRSCPVCRSSMGALTEASSVGLTPESDDDDEEEEEDLRVQVPRGEMLRHCNSLVLRGEKKGRSTLGMELKRSLSMGQSACVSIDIQTDQGNVAYYSSIRDESIRRFLQVSSKVRQSISRMCVGQGTNSHINLLPY